MTARLKAGKIAFLLVALAGIASALEVTPGSSCATFCLDEGESDGFDASASSTNSSDITCRDIDFSTKDKGIKYKNCLECLSKSKRVDEEESDIHWYLYNLRYALSTCLFSTPGASSNTQADSPCVIDHACRPLEDPLTEDNLDANSTDTYSYCDASDGAFTGKAIGSCISCLQASVDLGQSYLSNFVVALQAGCEQKPDPGSLLYLSGTVFTTNAVNITEAPVDITKEPSGAGSSTLTTGAIVGIAVGVGLFLLGGIALFIMYWRKQKRLERNEKSDAFRRGSGGSLAGTPDPILPTEMTTSLRSYTPQGGAGGYHSKGPSMTSGEYYDRLEEDIHGSRVNYNFDPRSKSRGPNTALPAHAAYIPKAVSRLKSDDSIGSSQRTASPPRGHSRSHTTSSTALQVCLNSSGSENTNTNTPPIPTIQQPPASRRAASVDHGPNVPPPPPGPPPKAHSKTPSISLPSIRKMRRPKQYAPPKVETEASNIQISQPVMNHEPRFQDRPLKGGPIMATEGQAVEDRPDVGGYSEVPMRSGKSALYGY